MMNGTKPVSIIRRGEWLYSQLDQDISLYGVAVKEPLIVSHHTDIRQVISLVLARSEELVYDDVIVEKDGQLLGIVSVKDLLYITQYKSPVCI
ncbi:CBS domain-containing protein [Bacillus tianshenii]|nr:CBS domain-containing protein [Bacillus tianshenii]